MKHGSRLALPFSVALLALGTLALPAHADDDDEAEMRAMAAAAKLISLEEAHDRALAAKPGAIVDADLERRFLGKGFDYEFEVIDGDGQSWEVHIDAKTGETRRVRREWFD
jgi:uncharacterized membrane protein YkoI